MLDETDGDDNDDLQLLRRCLFLRNLETDLSRPRYYFPSRLLILFNVPVFATGNGNKLFLCVLILECSLGR
jgi:hypothetical protein